MIPQPCRFIWNLKHFCHIFIRKLRFSRYTAEKRKCIPAYLTRMQRLLIEQTRRGYRGRERGERGAGEGRKWEGEGRKGGGRRENWRAGERVREKGEKGEGEGKKGPPLYPSHQAYHKEWPYGWSNVGRIYAQQQVTSIWRHRCRSKQFRLEDNISWQKTNFLKDKICVSYVLKQQNVGGAEWLNANRELVFFLLKKMWNGNSLVSGFCKRLVNLICLSYFSRQRLDCTAFNPRGFVGLLSASSAVFPSIERFDVAVRHSLPTTGINWL